MGFWSGLIVAPAVIPTIAGILKILEYFGLKPTETSMRGFLKSSGVVVTCMLLTWVGVGVDLYGRDRSPESPADIAARWSNYPLRPVRDRHFEGETVKLDGIEYINCVFKNVTFEYEGTAPTRLTNPQIVLPLSGERLVSTSSSNPIVLQTQEIVFYFSNVAGKFPSSMTTEMNGRTETTTSPATPW